MREILIYIFIFSLLSSGREKGRGTQWACEGHDVTGIRRGFTWVTSGMLGERTVVVYEEIWVYKLRYNV